MATVSNIDWPSSARASVERQKAELTAYFDLAKHLRLNVVVLQVRPVGDAFYASHLEPWSRYLTGAQGRPPVPAWDPLRFSVREAHARGIQLHAWLNPFRANMAPNWVGLAASHVAVRFRRCAHPYGRYLWMDPSCSDVQRRVERVVDDITTR